MFWRPRYLALILFCYFVYLVLTFQRRSADPIVYEFGVTNLGSLVVPGRVVLVTASDFTFPAHKSNFMDTAAEIEDRREWAERNGHDFYFHNMSGKVWNMWDKPAVIRNALEQNPKAEWAWWFDSDGLLMEYKYDFTERILSQAAFNNISLQIELKSRFTEHRAVMKPQPYADTYLIVTQDHNGFNAGSILFRRGVVTEAIIDMWLSDSVRRLTKDQFDEQAALAHVIITTPFVRNRTTWIKRTLINSYYQDYREEEKQLAVHMAGCTQDWCKVEYEKHSKIREKIRQKALASQKS